MTDEIKYKFVLENGDMFLSGMNNAGRTVEQFDNRAGKLGTTLMNATGKMQAMSQMFMGGELAEMSRGISNWADGLINSTIEVGSNLNIMYKRAVLFMDGNKKLVRESFNELEKFAVYTPFEYQPMLKMQANFMQYLGEKGIKSMGSWGEVGAKVNEQFAGMKITTTSMVADVASAMGITGEKFSVLQGQLQRLFLQGGSGRVKLSLRTTGLGNLTEDFVKGMNRGMSKDAMADQFNANLKGILSSKKWFGMSSVMGATLKTSIANIGDVFEAFQARLMGSFEDGDTVMTEFIKVIDGYASSLKVIMHDPEFIKGFVDSLISIAHGMEWIVSVGYKMTKSVMGFANAHPVLLKMLAVGGLLAVGLAKVVGIAGAMAGTILRLSGVVSMFTGRGTIGMNSYASATMRAAGATDALAMAQMKANGGQFMPMGSLGGGLKKAGFMKKYGGALRKGGKWGGIALGVGAMSYGAYKMMGGGAEDPNAPVPVSTYGSQIADTAFAQDYHNAQKEGTQIDLMGKVVKDNQVKKTNLAIEALKFEQAQLIARIKIAGASSDNGKVLVENLKSVKATLQKTETDKIVINELHKEQKNREARIFQSDTSTVSGGTSESFGTVAGGMGINAALLMPGALKNKGFFKNMKKFKTGGAKNMGQGLKGLVKPMGLNLGVTKGKALLGVKSGMFSKLGAVTKKIPYIGAVIGGGMEAFDFATGKQSGLEAGLATGAMVLGTVAGAMLGGPVGAMIGGVAFQWLAHKVFDVVEKANDGSMMDKIKGSYQKQADDMETAVREGTMTQLEKSKKMAQLNMDTAKKINTEYQQGHTALLLAQSGVSGVEVTKDAIAQSQIKDFKVSQGFDIQNPDGTTKGFSYTNPTMETAGQHTARLSKLAGDKDMTPADWQQILKEDRKDVENKVLGGTKIVDNKNIVINIASPDPATAGQQVNDALYEMNRYRLDGDNALPIVEEWQGDE